MDVLTKNKFLMKVMNMNTKIIKQLEAAFSKEFRVVENDLGALEQLVREKMQLLGQGLLQRIVDCLG